MPTWFEGIQKRARGLGKMAEELGASAGKAIDDAVAPAVEKLNTGAYQETKAAKEEINTRAKRREEIERRGRQR